ncbi:dihydrofolate reductase family protein [Asanoa sp. WMMD1127]|uniref:dihydrofolate reductase family protein n=1 Tax=Asanoa sp. WMMD1127 TaxID=3016107 RepID=UPI00241626CE|nr:dihydrofolate reductase family protein [Asanoa sp. WMMD1127]MDG4826145.1 dihydrofolate reductase family protein [Asanoa sp. WMMD1127]
MRVTITEFVSLDGVSQGPGSADEDRSEGFTRGGWLTPHADGRFIEAASHWLSLADGLLLGRRTYEEFAAAWPHITDPDDPFTERMNALPKHVVTATLTEAPWQPATLLRFDDVAARRARPGRELQIHGSARLGNALLSAGLVDAVRLVVAPTVVGAGRRLLEHPGRAVGLRLVSHEATPAGMLLLEYEPTGDAPVADYQGASAV